MLKHSPKVSHVTTRDFFDFNLSDINAKLGKNFRDSGLGSVWDR